MTLGLRDGEVHLVTHSPAWAEAGEAECRRLLAALSRWTSHVEHVGSTAVPGLAAKPVIDICLGVQDLLHADAMAEEMSRLGYDYPGDVGIPGERVFGREPGWRTHLVHVVVVDGPRWQAYLRFRDVLRADPLLRDEYESLKKALAASHAADRYTYTQRKTGFIQRVLGAPRSGAPGAAAPGAATAGAATPGWGPWAPSSAASPPTGPATGPRWPR
ncbi:GrpB family protein [Kineococcus gypseus]|uniref:GrpB family protein n=1 Tax=Kineococcus gypseus TaxID=1637102 RepID=UPI003D7CB6C9